MKVAVFSIGPLQTNCFVASQDEGAVVVDPGGDPAPVLRHLKANGLGLTHILVTHFHFDHVYGCRALAAATSAPILGPQDDAFLLENELGMGGFMGTPRVEPFDWQPLAPGRTEFLGQPCDVLPTPGHTPGSLTFHFPDAAVAFVGDLIFRQSIGRTDFPGGSLEDLLASVRERIFTLPGETALHSGHGPATTVHEERLHNPFFTQFMSRNDL
ncbi:MAG: MBL fold metallo-hydrolase [Desulfovibrionaceae bacterium]|jgi:glyoxylase-like metal-dependent hydrolase (beta-lactamase superfamily II)|nr:MBL fold metallo-hydrolase [Desulfovibrionaceae bacterium]